MEKKRQETEELQNKLQEASAMQALRRFFWPQIVSVVATGLDAGSNVSSKFSWGGIGGPSQAVHIECSLILWGVKTKVEMRMMMMMMMMMISSIMMMMMMISSIMMMMMMIQEVITAAKISHDLLMMSGPHIMKEPENNSQLC